MGLQFEIDEQREDPRSHDIGPPIAVEESAHHHRPLGELRREVGRDDAGDVGVARRLAAGGVQRARVASVPSSEFVITSGHPSPSK